MAERDRPEGPSLPSAVSRETAERIDHFAALFQKWSARMNLVAASTRDAVMERHVADSLQLFALAPEPRHWVDLGSGGGFPGVIMAICLAETGSGWVDLVESNQKKAAFLRVALTETGARGRVHAIRIEDAPAQIPTCDAISARALADLERLLGYSEPWFIKRPEIAGWFHKGRDYRREVAIARDRWSFDLVEHVSAIDPSSRILQIERLTRRQDAEHR